MPAGVKAWDKGMNWGKEGWRRSLPHLGDGVKEERETAAGVLLQRGGLNCGHCGQRRLREEGLQSACLLPWQEWPGRF